MEQWTESESELFIKYGNCFVPEREHQIDVICELIPQDLTDAPVLIDLCCGAGLLTEALLNRFSKAKVFALDISPTMLNEVQTRLIKFKDRLQVKECDLSSKAWQNFDVPIHAFVSSLAVHHLDGKQKQALFKDLHTLLAPGGALLIADIIRPLTQKSLKVAAQAWDAATRERSLQINGNLKAYEVFQHLDWNYFCAPDDDPIDKPSPIFDQLKWLEAAGFENIEVFWLKAGHAIYGGYKKNNKKQ